MVLGIFCCGVFLTKIKKCDLRSNLSNDLLQRVVFQNYIYDLTKGLLMKGLLMKGLLLKGLLLKGDLHSRSIRTF